MVWPRATSTVRPWSLIAAPTAADLHASFPEVKGFSPRNLEYMRAFGEAYPDEPFVQQVAAQIPWFHHGVLLDKVKERQERER